MLGTFRQLLLHRGHQRLLKYNTLPEIWTTREMVEVRCLLARSLHPVPDLAHRTLLVILLECLTSLRCLKTN